MFTAAVIGLGNIGQLYDYRDANGACILTHANGFAYHPKFDLVAGVDVNNDACSSFKSKFKKPAFKTISELFAHYTPDVISIAVPTKLHFSVFKEVVAYAPQAILCEKPLASTVYEGRLMNQLAEKAGTILLVNYMRRFEPGVLKIKRLIDQGNLGKIYKGVMWYSKGILNNGSHFIDLLSYLLGEVQDIKLINKGLVRGDDPEPDLKVKFGDVEVYFLAGREECFSVKELELMGTEGCLNYIRGGEEYAIRRINVNPLFPAYTVLEKDVRFVKTELSRYQFHVLDNLARSLEEGCLPLSSGRTALDTLVTVEEVVTLIKEG